MRGGAGLSKAVVAAAGVVALGLVGGCSGGDEAPPGGSGTSSASSASPSTTASSMPSESGTSTAAPEVQVPAAATKRTAAGAEAFARFYTTQLDEASVSGSTAAVSAMSLPSCKTCAAFFKVVNTRASRSEHQDKASFTIRLSSASPGSQTSVIPVDVLVDDAGGQIVDASGAVIEKLTPAKLNFRHTLKWASQGWRVADSEVVQ